MNQSINFPITTEPRTVSRWLCHCEDPAVLLATYDKHGSLTIKVRDRYWHVIGRVQTICPKCGREHVLVSAS
jgi:hypothetical protein